MLFIPPRKCVPNNCIFFFFKVRQEDGTIPLLYQSKGHNPITADFYWLKRLQTNASIKFHLHVKRKVNNEPAFPLGGFYSGLVRLLLYLKKQEMVAFGFLPFRHKKDSEITDLLFRLKGRCLHLCNWLYTNYYLVAIR